MNYALPTLVIATGLDGVPGHLAGDLTPACVPEGLGNKRFYDAMPGSTWMVNATAFGHGDVLDDLYYEGLVVSKHNQDLLNIDKKGLRGHHHGPAVFRKIKNW